MFRKTLSFLLLLSAVVLFFSGCATTTLQTNVAMTRTIVLDPVKKSEETIYLRVRNTAASKINLKPTLIQDLKKRGLRIVDDPQKAKYILNVNVLFANNLKEAQSLQAATTSGVNAGLMAGIESGSAKNGILVGAAAALIGGVIGDATEDSIYRAVIDISIKERKNQIIKVTHTINQSQASISNIKRAGFANEFSGDIKNVNTTSKLSDGLNDSERYDYESDYIQHKTRILVSAVKMGLNLKKAVPILEKKASYEISEIF